MLAQYIPDEELQHVMSAADVVVLPYLRILSSGAAMLALSFGRPVIAPRQGLLNDMIVSSVGLLYDPVDPQGLTATMADVRTRRFEEEEILRYARQYDWGRSAQTLLLTLDRSRQ